MADNKQMRSGGERRKVASQQGYDVSYFARKRSISRDVARELIGHIGNDRGALNAAAAKLATAAL